MTSSAAANAPSTGVSPSTDPGAVGVAEPARNATVGQQSSGEATPRIESLLSARLFLVPQLVGERLYFVSNLGGRLGLYVMDRAGSVPEPLLPPHIALHNPHMLGGHSFRVFPALGRILVMIDHDGDEVYQPMWIPQEGGFPVPAFDGALAGRRVHLGHSDLERGIVFLAAQRLDAAINETWRGDVRDGSLTRIHEGMWGEGVADVDERGAGGAERLALVSGYSAGDTVLSLWQDGRSDVLLGTTYDQREPGENVTPLGLGSCSFTEGGGLLLRTAHFDDRGTLAYLDLPAIDLREQGRDATTPEARGLEPVTIAGIAHDGIGELTHLEALKGDRYLLGYNIEGVSWLYEGRLDEDERILALERVLVGEGPLADGVIEHVEWHEAGDEFVLSFSSATTPTQLYTLEGPRRDIVAHTREKLLGLPADVLAPGEDASFTSFDGLRVSARLYRPSPALGFEGPRPLVYYVHGGPQGQERPDFAWFSMPLIQYLTLRGFAVFVPNARGSSGYGLSYMKRVDRDWGGDDRLDHVHAMTRVLSQDPGIDVARAAVVGRSYGGYMTLTLAARHPELWAAACDMFGPYDLLTFSERIPETWKTYFKLAIGDPEVPADRAALVERSPRTHIDGLRCPLLVIQGANDPRVVEAESADVVEHLRSLGRTVDYLVFEDEGHDVLKHENRVRCYDAITDFFVEHLRP